VGWAKPSLTEERSDPGKRDALAPGVSFSRIAAFLRGATRRPPNWMVL